MFLEKTVLYPVVYCNYWKCQENNAYEMVPPEDIIIRKSQHIFIGSILLSSAGGSIGNVTCDIS